MISNPAGCQSDGHRIAAFVGGIMANMLHRADFIMMNMKIQCNVIS